MNCYVLVKFSFNEEKHVPFVAHKLNDLRETNSFHFDNMLSIEPKKHVSIKTEHFYLSPTK